MVQQDFEILRDSIEFIETALLVPVAVDEYTETKVGSSRDEEYFDTTTINEDVRTVECPIEYVYKESNPDKVYEEKEAREFVKNQSWDSSIIADLETVELHKNGEKWIVAIDTSEVDQYK